MSFRHLKPSLWLGTSIVIFIVNLLMGPYSPHFVSFDGIFFGIACILLLFIGAWLTESRRPLPLNRFILTPRGEQLLRVAAWTGLISGAVYVWFVLFLSGVNVSAGVAAIRHTFVRQPDTISQVWWAPLAYFLAYSGLAAWLVMCCIETVFRRRTVALILCSAFSPAIVILIQGGRNPALLSLSLVLVGIIMRVNRNSDPTWNSRAAKIVVALAGLTVIAMSMALFLWRTEQGARISLILEQISIGQTRMTLRSPYQELNESFNGILDPLYALSFYISHSAVAFSELYRLSDYAEVAWGSFHLRVIGFMVRPLGIPFPEFLTIIERQPFVGLYSTAIQGVLLDFGLYLTPLIFLILGCIAGSVHRLAVYGSFAAQTFLPLILVVIAVSPVYHFHWGGSDYVAILLILLLALVPQPGTSSRFFDPTAAPGNNPMDE